MNKHIEGLIAAPFAPMHDDGSLNLEPIGRYAAFLKNNGVVGAFVNGTTGESASLTIDERLLLAEQWVSNAPSELKVIIHVGHTCLQDCRRMAAHAREIGASAVGAMAPYFFKPSDVDGLVEWCAAVASAAPELPFFYYHIPSMSGVSFPMHEFLSRAGRIANLAGIKFTFEDLDDYQRCVEFDGGCYDVLFGRDELLLGSLERGARGAVGSTYNFAAPLYCRIIEQARRGDNEGAQALQHKACRMIDTVLAGGCGIGSLKAVMQIVGLPCGPARLPLRNPSPAEIERLRAELDKIGFSEFCNTNPAG